MHAVDRALHAYLLGRGHRLVTRSEVISLVETSMNGATRAAAVKAADSLIRNRKGQGRWVEVQPAVYLVGLGPLTGDEERRALMLAVPPPVALSQLCAFVEWDLDGITSAPLEITVAHSTHVALRGAVTVHRSRKSEGFVDRDGLVVTSVERTLLECAPRIPRHSLEQGFTSAWRRGLTTPAKTLTYLDQFGSPQRRGTAQLRAVVSQYGDGGRAPGSVAEVALLDALRPGLAAAGIEEPVRQFELALPDGTSATLDTAWPTRRKAIEPAGLRWHGNTRAQAYDYRRRALAREVGWEIEQVAPVALRDHRRETVASLIRFLQAPSLSLWVQEPPDVA